MSQRAIPLVDLSKYNEGSAEDKNNSFPNLAEPSMKWASSEW